MPVGIIELPAGKFYTPGLCFCPLGDYTVANNMVSLNPVSDSTAEGCFGINVVDDRQMEGDEFITVSVSLTHTGIQMNSEGMSQVQTNPDPLVSSIRIEDDDGELALPVIRCL